MAPAVVLVGFMGTGKSEVGQLIAKKLGVSFVDVDAEIVNRAGLSIPDLFRQQGEPAFRDLETDVLTELLERSDGVISCGGGVVVTPANLERLKQCPGTVCLTATPKTILERVGQDPNRPLLKDGEASAMERIRGLLAERETLYAQIPRQVATDGFRPSEVADQVLSDLRN